MRGLFLSGVLGVAATLPAQSFYVPTNTPNTGTNNAFPFNTTDMRYQALIMATDLGSAPCLIRGFALAPVTTGSLSFTRVLVRMAHIAAPTLSTTFDANLAAGALTVMDAPGWKWHVVGGVWNEVDLQIPYFYNGIDNLVVEFQVYGRVGSGGMYRDGTNQRVYQGSYTGQLTGSNGGLSAFKMRVIVGDASTQTFGVGCPGSNLQPLTLSLSGSSKLGGALTVGLSNGRAYAPCALNLGTTTMQPVFPFDLGIIGAPGCLVHTDALASFPMATDATGSASAPLTIPQTPTLVGYLAYFQWGSFDVGANAANLTTSGYGRALIGN